MAVINQISRILLCPTLPISSTICWVNILREEFKVEELGEFQPQQPVIQELGKTDRISIFKWGPTCHSCSRCWIKTGIRALLPILMKCSEDFLVHLLLVDALASLEPLQICKTCWVAYLEIWIKIQTSHLQLRLSLLSNNPKRQEVGQELSFSCLIKFCSKLEKVLTKWMAAQDFLGHRCPSCKLRETLLSF